VPPCNAKIQGQFWPEEANSDRQSWLGIVARQTHCPQESKKGHVVRDSMITCFLLRSMEWLQLGGEIRERMETLEGVGFVDKDNTYLLERLRLNLNLVPLSGLRFVFQAQDSRAFFTDVSPAPRDPMDLRIGYMQLGNSESGQ
jgi:hypothetical protein